MAKHQFQTEVDQLLKLIIHSLYSHREIFLRELVSNASDALDKMKYLSLSDDRYKSIAFDPRIDISYDGKAKTLTISDTGLGMNEADLVENLGTIARSGTRLFLEALAADARKNSELIGRFGVGFYSSFMVAGKVEVLTKKAGEEEAWLWSSDGQGGYDIEKAERGGQGTTVTLFLNEDGEEYASRWKIEDIVKKYSNHIAFPIFVRYEEEYDDKGKKLDKPREKTERVNSASALWKRQKSELSESDYIEFYKTISHEDEDPLLFVHTKAEGTIEYTTLFFIPKKAPFDMFQADYRPGVKLYVKRVFITDDDKELLPVYLRFVRGVIDSEDLPLNVSREILQQNKILTNIRQASVKKILGELSSLSESNKEKYEAFIQEFNKPLKEGLYADFANREALIELIRFRSTKADGWASLADYKSRMKDGQKAIYYVTGGDEAQLRKSPLLEMYAKSDIEVLIMCDEIDDIVMPTVGRYKDVELKSVNRSGSDNEIGEKGDGAKAKEMKSAIEKIKKALGDKVKDVKVSKRLSDSPSCVIMDEADPSLQMQQILKAMGQKNLPEVKPILEVNPDHPLVARVKEEADETLVEDISLVLLGQALMVEGIALADPADFVKRMNRLIK